MSNSCSDDIDKENLYIFKGKTITQFIESSEDFSLFGKIMHISQNTSKSKTKISSLLGTAGQYTVFVPTNDAIKDYLKAYYGTDNYNIDTISLQVANKIALNCIIDLGKEGESAWTLYDIYGKEGVQPESTLNGRYLNIQQEGNKNIYVNNSLILSGEIECENGTIYTMNSIIEPIPTTLSGLIAGTGDMSIFNHLLELTTWNDSLIKYKDDTYVSLDNGKYPKHRMYGYTAFVETDEVFHECWGIPIPERDAETGYVRNWGEIMTAIEAKCKEAYPSAKDLSYVSKDNAVNRFVSYHLLKCKCTYDNLTYSNNIMGYTPGCSGQGIQPIDVHSYFQTMGYPYRLLKVTRTGKDDQVWLNRRSLYDNSFLGNYEELVNIEKGVLVRNTNNYCANGNCFPIDSILLYSEKVRNVVLNERIRYSINHVIPELYNNLIANHESSKTYPGSFFDDVYFGNKDREVTAIYSSNYDYRMLNGTYCYFNNPDVAVPLLTVPYSGNWEVRIQMPRKYGEKNSSILLAEMGTNPWSPSSMYLKTNSPIDMPMIENIGATLFWEEDWKCNYGKDTLACLENDKRLRKHHLMAGPKSIGYNNWTVKDSKNLSLGYAWKYVGARSSLLYCRYIVYRGYLDENKRYYLHLKNMFNLTYPLIQNIYELVPENVYDNPEKAEDIW